MPDAPTLTAAQIEAIDRWLRLNQSPDQIAADVAGWLAEARAEGWRLGHNETCPQGWGCTMHAPLAARGATS